MSIIMSGYLSFTHEEWSWMMRMSIQLSKREYALLMVIVRYTHGFRRKEARLSASYFQSACGIQPTHVPGALRKLKDKGIIEMLPKERGTNVIFFDWKRVITPTELVGENPTELVEGVLPNRLETTTESVINPYRIGREESKEENKEGNKDEEKGAGCCEPDHIPVNEDCLF